MEFKIVFSIILISSIINYSQQTDFSEDDIFSTIDTLPITCSSTIRLQNIKSGYFLHSSELSYGSGSGQQAVTGFDGDHDYNSLWQIKEGEPESGEQQLCRTGQKIKCGDTIRLEHMNTGKNVHSHTSFDSPVSGRQEVSCYGNNGDGDVQDNWEVECDTDDVKGYVYGKTKFYLKHKATGLYLYTDHASKFTEYNCRRCPIVGHTEISAARGKLKNGIWKVHSGFFFPDLEAEDINSEY